MDDLHEVLSSGVHTQERLEGHAGTHIMLPALKVSMRSCPVNSSPALVCMRGDAYLCICGFCYSLAHTLKADTHTLLASNLLLLTSCSA